MQSKTVITLVMLLAVTLAGRIRPWGEPILTYPNKGWTSQIDLFFSLETNLPVGHYLRVQLPFAANLPTGTTFWLWTASPGTRTVLQIPTPSSGVIQATNTPNGVQNYLTFGSTSLTAGQAYQLRIAAPASGNFTTTETVGFLGWIQLETLSPANSVTSSSATDQAISYDVNMAFAPIHLLPAPSTSTSLTTTSNDTNNGTAGMSYIRQFKIQLGADLWFNPLIRITWDNSAFVIGSTNGATNITSVDTGLTTTATPLAAGTYSSSVSGTNVWIWHGSNAVAARPIIYNISVTNPTMTATGTQTTTPSVFVMYRYNMNVTDYATGAALTVSFTATGSGGGGGSSTVCQITTSKILLAWNLDTSTLNTFQQKVFSIYASTAADSAYRYQTVRVNFALNSTLATAAYTVAVTFCASNAAAASCDILENSIVHSFGTGVTASVSSQGIATSAGVVQIVGVSSFQSTNYVAARVAYLEGSVAAGGTVIKPGTPAAMGQTMSTTTVGAVSISNPAAASTTPCQSSSSLTVNAIKLATASPYLMNLGGNGPAISMATTDTNWATFKGAAYSATPSPQAGWFGVASTSTTSYHLQLVTTLLTNTATNSFGAAAAATDLGTGSGVDVFLNPNLWNVTTSTLATNCYWAIAGTTGIATGTLPTVSGAAAAATWTLHCNGANVAGTFARLRSWTATAATTPTPTFVLATTTAAGTNAYLTFAWENSIQLLNGYTGASLKADGMANEVFVAVIFQQTVVAGSAIVATGTTATDLGELGGTSTALTGQAVPVAGYMFFSQYIINPLSSGLANATLFLSGSYAGLGGNTIDSSSGLLLLRVRGTLQTADLFSSSIARLALFLQTGMQYISSAATPTTAYPGNVRCIVAGAPALCSAERMARTTSAVAQGVNNLEGYQILSAPVTSLTTSTTFALTFLLKPAVTAVGAVKIRLASVVSNYYINGRDTSVTINAGTLAAPGATTCNAAQTTGIRLTPNASNIVGTTATSQTLTIQAGGTWGSAAASKFGAFVWCTASWNWQTSSSSLGGVAFGNSTDSCSFFDYAAVDGTLSGTGFYCLFCPLYTASVSTTAQTVTISSFQTAPTVDLTTSQYYFFADDGGQIAERNVCPTTAYANLFTPGAATVSNTAGSYWAAAGQKVSISITAPSGLKTPSVSTIVLSGVQNVTGYATDSLFPYGTSDGSAAIYLVPSGSLSTASAYYAVTTVNSYGSGAISIQVPGTIPSNLTSGTAWTLIIWGHNGATYQSTSYNSVFYVQTKASSTLVDQSPNQGTASAWPVANVTTPLNVPAVLWQRPFLNARGYFRFDFSFPSSRNWFYGDIVRFNLDVFSTSTINANNSVVKCKVTDLQDNVQQIFKSCTLTLGASPKVEIVALNPWSSGTSSSPVDFAATNGYRVYLDNAVTNAAPASGAIKTVYGQVIHNGANSGSSQALVRLSNATDSNLGSLLTAPSFTTSPVLASVQKGISEQQEIRFTLSSPAAVNSTGRIVVVFPSYYNQGLHTRNSYPYCSIDGVQVYCYNPDATRLKTLYIESLPSKAANQAFVLRIVGVSAPASTTYTVENFWVQINGDMQELSASTISAATTVTDSSYAAMTIAPIHVQWYSVSATSTRSTAMFTWSFTLGNNGLAVNTTIQAMFPDSWGIGWGNGVPTCRVYDNFSPSVVYSASAAAQGNNFWLPLSAAASPYATLNLECSSVRTPDSADTVSYPTQDVQIRVLDSTGSTIVYRSAPHAHNVDYSLQFTKPAALTTLKFNAAASGMFSLIPGTYNALLTLPISARASKPFSIAPGNSSFVFYPALQVAYGQTAAAGFLGGASSLSPNIYQVYFTLNITDTYTAPSSVWVMVVNQQVTINSNPALSSAVVIPFITGTTAKSVPIVFDLSLARPYSDITLTPTFSTLPGGVANTNFTVAPSSLQLTPAAPMGSFVYTTTGTTQAATSTAAGGSVVVTYTLSGTNAAAYTVASTQTVQASAGDQTQQAAVPTLSIAIDSSDQNAPTKRILNFNLGIVNSAVIYWVVGLAGSTPSAPASVVTMGSMPMGAMQFSASNVAQTQQGWFNLAKGTGLATISGLTPGQYYEIRAVPVSPTNQSTTSSILFQWMQASNGAAINKWLYNFTTYPTAAQRQPLFCALCQTLQVPTMNIIGINGDYCGNRSSWYNSTNSTVLGVFFYPLMNVDSDTIMTTTNLVSMLNTTASNTTINALITAGSGLTYSNILASDGTTTNHQLSATFSSTTTAAGNNYVSITAALNETGYILVALDSNSSTTPTNQDMRANAINGAGPRTFSQYQQFYYNNYFQAGAAITVNFSGLAAGTSYNIYAVGTNSDPGLYANFTSATPMTIAVKTTNTGAGSPTAAIHLTVFGSILLALIGFFTL